MPANQRVVSGSPSRLFLALTPKELSRASKESDLALGELNQLLKKDIAEMIAEYKLPQNEIVRVYDSTLISANYQKYEAVARLRCVIEDFLELYLRLYLEGYVLKTPFSAFMFISEQTTANIIQLLYKKLYTTYWKKLFECLIKICKTTRFPLDKFEVLESRLHPKLLLRFSISTTYGPSTTRNVYNDEYLGLLSAVVGDSFPLLMYELASPALLNMKKSEPEEQQNWANIVMIFIEVLLFKTHQKYIDIIKNHIHTRGEERDLAAKKLQTERLACYDPADPERSMPETLAEGEQKEH